MKLRNLLEVQKVIEGSSIPYDVLEFDSTHHSQSKDTEINILDLHLTHAIRILNNYLTDDLYPRYSDRQQIKDTLRVLKDNVDDIIEIVNK
jgi:hypothetical protein